MTRLQELRRFASKSARGMEIAPYFNPIAPKAQGFDVMIVDVFDTDRLRENALHDPAIPEGRIQEIEPVDIVSDASALHDVINARGLQGTFDYILSSHNFEHLPDPIRFLQGCSAALRPGGMLTMAIPDYRTCYDHYRMPTRLTDWLSAHHRQDRQPTPATLFDSRSNKADFDTGSGLAGSCRIEVDDPVNFHPHRSLREHYADYVRWLNQPEAYIDAHCSTLFGETFELLVRDLGHLGLTDLEVFEITETRGHEFFVHLRKPAGQAAAADDVAAFEARRERLLRKISANLGAAVFENRTLVHRLRLTVARAARAVKQALARVFGEQTTTAVRDWNRARKARLKKRGSQQ